jgi:prepilin-type N-terminal cleavage/methylation domain-containing protein
MERAPVSGMAWRQRGFSLIEVMTTAKVFSIFIVGINSPTGSVANRTVEVSTVVTNPFKAQRATAPTQFTEKYLTILTLNTTENDP